MPVPWDTSACPTAELPQFTSYTQTQFDTFQRLSSNFSLQDFTTVIHSYFIIIIVVNIFKTFVILFILGPYWASYVKACCSQHWQALETSVPAIPQTVTQPSPHSSWASFWCSHWVASVEIRDHHSTLTFSRRDWFRQHSSVAEHSIRPVQIGMCNSDCLSDSLIYGACCSSPVWNVIGINSGTGWYHNHFDLNSLWEELWVDD